jgi:hypothetical protein
LASSCAKTTTRRALSVNLSNIVDSYGTVQVWRRYEESNDRTRGLLPLFALGVTEDVPPARTLFENAGDPVPDGHVRRESAALNADLLRFR